MKKRLIPLIAVVLVVAVFVIWLLISDNFCIGRIENRTDGQWSQLHVYMSGEMTINFPRRSEDQACIFQWETGRGAFSAEITDADGAVLYRTTSAKNGSAVVEAHSDLTLKIQADGHGGVFSLTGSSDPNLLAEDPAPKYRLLGDGGHSGEDLTETFQCLRFDGKYLNFYVENYGNSPVVISINGEHDRTIPSGASGHTRAAIPSGILAQEMIIQCVGTEDDDLRIYWKAAQRDSNSGPEEGLLRLQVITTLWQHAGMPTVECENPFTDISDADWFYDAILWALSEGIIDETSANTFNPYATASRAQAITFLWHYLGRPQSNAEITFSDVSGTEWYAPAIRWAVEQGISNGMDDGNFGVSVECTRTHINTFLKRAFE